MQLTKIFKVALLLGTPLWFSSVVQANVENPIEKATSSEVSTFQETTKKSGTIAVNQVNINTATAVELQKMLIGIGAKKAEAIVQYRTSHGAFDNIDQLLNVQGIGKSTLDKNRERIILQ